MSIEQMLTTALLTGLLGIAVAIDLYCHRIPNPLIALGVVVGLVAQFHFAGVAGLWHGAVGMLVGFGIFLPLYAAGGMAAGDVKLMAMVGALLTPAGAFWAALFSMIAGGVCGLVLVILHGQAKQTLGRYWLMARTRTYLVPEPNEVAGKPFPYAVAVLLGTLSSILWQSVGR